MQTLVIGDEFLTVDLPDNYDYGYRENGALMAYLTEVDALNLHVSTVTGTPADPSRSQLAFDQVLQDAEAGGYASEVLASDRAVYSYIEDSE